MCQKATGGLFGPYVNALRDAVTWTRGQPAHFQSSNKVRRGFCRTCGTPSPLNMGKASVLRSARWTNRDRSN
ncbi:GFA family protein [Sphingomonas sp. SORGH_AS_0879]|uniref:GFA family protein n=1 Tax=Sphingomonas sp. SORGH_AS_0879 TaxID=3041790 RepID=UPI003592FA38